MKLRHIIYILIICYLLSACTPVYTGEIPELKFSPVTHTDNGTKCFYLFDDNPEHLHEEFLADAPVPSSIAHFSSLKPGIYTMFSYHHRGDSSDANEDLFFDVLFRTDTHAEYKITKIGLDHNWQWNKAWADFSGVDVYSPEYLKSFNCSCPDLACAKPDAICPEDVCSCVVRDEIAVSDSNRYVGLGSISELSNNNPQLLSELIPIIGEEKINEIRYGSYNEPIWLMMEFEILSGELTADTIAYNSLDAAKQSFDIIKPGRVAKEPQYKGIAENAPVVTAELSYTFDDTTRTGALPVKIFNQRHPDGYTAKDGAFGTNVNTWKIKELIAAESAESDMMRLTYRDESKLSLYGTATTVKSDIWHFDPFHTSLYSDSDNPNFSPNIPMAQIDFPTGRTKPDFYGKYVLNLGNFGVRYLYTINLTNNSSEPKIFCFSMNSLSGQVYRYRLTQNGEAVCDDGGRYIMKRFDADPAEDPKSDSEPKQRLEPSKYTSTERFTLEPNKAYTLHLEVVTLTGCDAPMTNILSIE